MDSGNVTQLAPHIDPTQMNRSFYRGNFAYKAKMIASSKF